MIGPLSTNQDYKPAKNVDAVVAAAAAGIVYSIFRAWRRMEQTAKPHTHTPKKKGKKIFLCSLLLLLGGRKSKKRFDQTLDT
jgi:hypothetical protein